LTWDANTDLDLSVRDPMGYYISFSHMGVSTGGGLLKDVTNGPNGVEFVSWGLKSSGNRGPSGHNIIRVSTYKSLNDVPFFREPNFKID
jgi:uncharacterized protein YfaP (DUF2135 family)